MLVTLPVLPEKNDFHYVHFFHFYLFGYLFSKGMDGQDILRMFNENRRLPKPENCSVIIYQIMWSCWQFK